MKNEQYHIKLFSDINKKEYGDKYDSINWISEERKESAENERNALLDSLAGKVKYGYADSKLDVTELSPGCRTCGEGTWSCLFINGKCNCRCFYCPTDQEDIGLPTTNTVQFPNPEDYTDYINSFGFKGVSISGGEPLLTFEKTLEFISRVRRDTDPSTYIWMYTNGTLSNREKLLQLKDAGLNEIRFDLSAVEYNLLKVKEAVGIIENVTVEIPAIPEDFEILKSKIIEMADSGVSYLNLHQMRLTPYNFKNLMQRNYTYLHGEKVTVLESELTALKAVEFVKSENIHLPVNYCSFIYKNRFQRSAARKRSTRYLDEQISEVTENGFLRVLTFSSDTETTGNIIRLFEEKKIDDGLYRYESYTKRFFISGRLLDYIKHFNIELKVNYYDSKILQNVTYSNPFRTITLNTERNLYIERFRYLPEIILSGKEVEVFNNLINLQKNDFEVLEEKFLMIARAEFLGKGLQPYI